MRFHHEGTKNTKVTKDSRASGRHFLVNSTPPEFETRVEVSVEEPHWCAVEQKHVTGETRLRISLRVLRVLRAFVVKAPGVLIRRRKAAPTGPEIERAAAGIEVQGVRYDESSQRMINR